MFSFIINVKDDPSIINYWISFNCPPSQRTLNLNSTHLNVPDDSQHTEHDENVDEPYDVPQREVVMDLRGTETVNKTHAYHWFMLRVQNWCSYLFLHYKIPEFWTQPFYRYLWIKIASACKKVIPRLCKFSFCLSKLKVNKSVLRKKSSHLPNESEKQITESNEASKTMNTMNLDECFSVTWNTFLHSLFMWLARVFCQPKGFNSGGLIYWKEVYRQDKSNMI